MFFDRFDIVEAYWLYFCENYSGMFHPNNVRRCRIETNLKFKPAPNLSYKTLGENSKYIYDSLVAKNFTSRMYINKN